MYEMHTGDELPERLAGLDLNLLVTFDALLRERSVTRAASRIGITQSAMSHALRRLRTLLGDPVLVRGPGGMLPTPRAEALEVPVRRGLDCLGRALRTPAEFDPKRARRAFRLATPDLFDMVAMPRLMQVLAAAAPQIDIIAMPLPLSGLRARLETGDLDLAVAARVPGDPEADEGEEGLLQRVLLRDQFVCMLRKGHPALGGRAKGPRKRNASAKGLSLEGYAALSHVVVSPTGRGGSPIDVALSKRKLTRRVAARVPSFGTALALAAETDLVLTAPSALAAVRHGSSAFLTTCPLPLPLPRHAVRMVWHARFGEDPGHRWMRETMIAVARSIAASIE